jgi:hypothetical protein
MMVGVKSLKKEKRGERTKMNSHRRISGLLSHETTSSRPSEYYARYVIWRERQ